MSDGGKAEDKRSGPSNAGLSGTNHFGREISRIAVAQVCESIGFEGFHKSALDSLADIAIGYMCDLGKTSRFYANLAGRTECNVFDIIQGLEDLYMPQGFSGASEVHGGCAMSSGAIAGIMEFIESAAEIPFAQPVPQFPVTNEQKLMPSFSQMMEVPIFKHIPAWLPAFPDPHTYLQTPVWNERVSDPRTDRIELVRQHRKAERSLLSLQQRLLCNVPSAAEADDRGDELDVSEMESSFLAEPFPNGERESSPIILPAKLSGKVHSVKGVSLLETFAPAIEAMRDGLDSGSDGEKIVPEKRTSIVLPSKTGKKVLCESSDMRIRSKFAGRPSTWFGREEENDKKRRVEFILRQSMENQQELSQL